MNINIKKKIKTMSKKLILILIVMIIIYIILKLLSGVFINGDKKIEMTYDQKLKEKADTAIFEGKIDEDDKDKFSNYINTYVNACNQKDYEKVYSMITDECKNQFYPNIEDLKEYIDLKFDRLKMYEYQNLSNVDNMYVYQLFLFDDVSAYGTLTSPKKSINYISIIKDENKNIKLSLNGYLNTEIINKKYQISNMNILIKSRDIYYDHVDFNIQFENLGNQNLVFRYDNAKYIISNDTKNVIYQNTNHILEYLFINANSDKELMLSFDKSFDSTKYNDNKIEINDLYLLDATKFQRIITEQVSINSLPKDYISTNIELGL